MHRGYGRGADLALQRRWNVANVAAQVADGRVCLVEAGDRLGVDAAADQRGGLCRYLVQVPARLLEGSGMACVARPSASAIRAAD